MRLFGRTIALVQFHTISRSNTMALVPVGNGSGYWLTVSLTDNGGDISTLSYELQSADMATAITDTSAILAAIALNSDSVVSGYNLGIRYTEDAFVYPVSGVENQNKARIVVQLTTGTEKARIDIPAPKPSIFNATSGKEANVVDIGGAAVTAYIALFEAGAEAFISDGEIADFPVEGRRVSSRKGFRG